MALIPRQKVSKRKIDGLSKAVVNAIMKEPDTKTKTGRRDMALIVLLYGTAARLDEILSMKVGQLHLNEPKPFATVMGKGSKPRTLYLLPKAVAHLTAYMKEYHPEGRQERFLFYSRNHNAYGKLTQPAIDKRLKLYAQRAHEKCPEVPLNLHAHQFRHAKSSHWLEDGMNIVQVSLLMGHAHIQTTMGYLDITTEQESKALATLEDENEAKLSKKWKGRESSLLALCGLQ
jgi:site-specific recombinase XerD